MKKILMLLAIVTTLTASAQKVKVETDKFTHETRISTDRIWLKQGLGEGQSMAIWSVDGQSYLTVYGYGVRGAHTIGENDALLILLDDGSTVTAQSKCFQQYSLKQGPYNSIDKVYDFNFILAPSDVDALAAHIIKSFRIPGQEGYTDFDVKDKNANKLMNVAAEFNEALKKM